MKSILQDAKECYLCRKKFDIENVVGLEEHHIFGGANRKISEKDGIKVWLCREHHNTPPNGVHFDYAEMEQLRIDGQRAWQEKYNGNFIERYGRNYL